MLKISISFRCACLKMIIHTKIAKYQDFNCYELYPPCAFILVNPYSLVWVYSSRNVIAVGRCEIQMVEGPLASPNLGAVHFKSA